MESQNTSDRLAALQKQLLNFFGGDVARLKRFATECESLDFKIRDNIDAISSYPEHFSLLITYSDLGILSKLTDSLNILKNKENK